MDRIFNDAKDKNVAVRILYGKTSGDFLYHDEATTEKVSKEDVLDAFFKGMLVLMNGEYYKIVQCKADESGYVLTGYNGTSTVTFKTDGAAAASTVSELEESEQDLES